MADMWSSMVSSAKETRTDENKMDNPRLLILGAGVVGLSTAVQCQLTWPRADVTIMADKIAVGTTSDGAGGIFRPTPAKTPKVPPDVLRKWLRDSWDHLDHLVHSTDAAESGVQMVSGYQFYNKVKENPLEKEFLYHYRNLTQKEMMMFPGTEGADHGFFVTTIMAEGPIYIRYLLKRFTLKGGKLVKRKLTSFEELVGQYDVVINCTALGSQQLCKDSLLTPIRGQLIKVKAPWIKHTILYGDAQQSFVYPGRDYVVLGTTRQEGDYDIKERKQDTLRILTDAVKILPSLKKAEIVSVWVGLRPHRAPLRLEKEILKYKNGELKMVHNYGHGAEGISLSWGTAVHAVRLVAEQLSVSVRDIQRLGRFPERHGSSSTISKL